VRGKRYGVVTQALNTQKPNKKKTPTGKIFHRVGCFFFVLEIIYHLVGCSTLTSPPPSPPSFSPEVYLLARWDQSVSFPFTLLCAFFRYASFFYSFSLSSLISPRSFADPARCRFNFGTHPGSIDDPFPLVSISLMPL